MHCHVKPNGYAFHDTSVLNGHCGHTPKPVMDTETGKFIAAIDDQVKGVT
jgi:hypothetical protein